MHVGNETVEHVDKDLLVFLLGEDHLEVLVVKKIDELSANIRKVFWFRPLSRWDLGGVIRKFHSIDIDSVRNLCYEIIKILSKDILRWVSA